MATEQSNSLKHRNRPNQGLSVNLVHFFVKTNFKNKKNPGRSLTNNMYSKNKIHYDVADMCQKSVTYVLKFKYFLSIEISLFHQEYFLKWGLHIGYFSP
jgi:hypothetical protein